MMPGGRWAAIGTVALLVLITGASSRRGARVPVWQTPPGAVAAAFVPGVGLAAVAATAFDPAAGRVRSRLALVDPASARERSAVEYRNSNCCGIPAVGVLADGSVYVAGDELLVVAPQGDGLRRTTLPAFTMDAAALGSRILVGSGRGDVLAFHDTRLLWTAYHRDLMAVALSPAGLAAAASPRAVAFFDGRVGERLREVALNDTRAVDIAFVQPALLVVAQRTMGGDLMVRAVDVEAWRVRWAVSLGPTTLPVVEAAGGVVVVSDVLGRVGVVLTPSGSVLRHWAGVAGGVYVAGSPQGAVARALGPRLDVYDAAGQVRWRGSVPGRVLGLRLHGRWLAVAGTTTPQTYATDRLWFFRVDR